MRMTGFSLCDGYRTLARWCSGVEEVHHQSTDHSAGDDEEDTEGRAHSHAPYIGEGSPSIVW